MTSANIDLVLYKEPYKTKPYKPKCPKSRVVPPSSVDNLYTSLGTGAPRVLGTNEAFGVNWVFGDTLSNYVSGDQGYVVANASVSASTVAVPEPGMMTLMGLGLLGISAVRRRRAA